MVTRCFFLSALAMVVQGAAASGACPEGRPRAETAQGVVCGRTKKAVWSGASYDSFQGMPYAPPPVGELRFKPPAKPESWAEPRDASSPKSECPQPFSPLGGSMAKGSEDCLYLNVYTPQKPSGEKPMSVMVWIHGGAFHSGNGGPMLYGPDHFMTNGVVLVTLNYRLGPLGFLCLQTEEAPGNVGLRDQIAALQWVQTNIASFGGNASDVTVFGESAGGASVHLLTLTLLARGLYHKAIMQSGVGLNPWAFKGPEHAVANAQALIKHTNCSHGASTEEHLACLRRLPANKLVAPSAAARTQQDQERMLNIVFTPTLDGTVLPAEPLALLAKANRVPVLAGNTNREGFIAMPLLRMANGRELWQDALERGVPAHTFGLDPAQMGPAFLRHFLGGGRLTPDNDVKFAIAFGEWQFIEGNLEALRARLEGDAPPPQYFYFFTFNGTKNYAKLTFGARAHEGAAHADELFYIFENGLFAAQRYNESAPEVHCTRALIALWTNFAKFGNPTPEGSGLPKWEPYTKERPVYMELGRGLRLVEGDVNPEHRSFWRACREGHCTD